jgi:hypothetical protein
MQNLKELEARARHRAEALDAIRRSLRAVPLQRPGTAGVIERRGATTPADATEPIEPLLRDEARAAARLKIVVDELLAAHCEVLRLSPWGQALLVPAETALLAANEAYHPWDRVLRFGKTAIQEIRTLAALTNSRERIDAERRVEDAIQGLVNGVDLLARLKPDSELPLLKANVTRSWDREAEILAAMDSVEMQSVAERAAVVKAQAELEIVNQQILAAAWARIPLALRP